MQANGCFIKNLNDMSPGVLLRISISTIFSSYFPISLLSLSFFFSQGLTSLKKEVEDLTKSSSQTNVCAF